MLGTRSSMWLERSTGNNKVEGRYFMRGTYYAAMAMVVVALGFTGCNKTDLSTPKAAGKTFATALKAGDAETAKASSTGGDPALIDTMATAVKNMYAVNDAAIAKFGEADGKTVMGDSGQFDPKSFEDATEAINGDTATVTPKTGQPMPFKKVDGVWKVDLGNLGGGLFAAMGKGMFETLGKNAAELTDEINAGKYKTAADAKMAMEQKMGTH